MWYVQGTGTHKRAPQLRGRERRRSRTRWPTRLPRSSSASILRAWPPPGRRPPRPVACPGTASLRLPARRSGRCPSLGRRLGDIEPFLVSWVVNSPVVPAAKIRSTSCAARSLYAAFVGMPPLWRPGRGLHSGQIVGSKGAPCPGGLRGAARPEKPPASAIHVHQRSSQTPQTQQ